MRAFNICYGPTPGALRCFPLWPASSPFLQWQVCVAAVPTLGAGITARTLELKLTKQKQIWHSHHTSAKNQGLGLKTIQSPKAGHVKALISHQDLLANLLFTP